MKLFSLFIIYFHSYNDLLDYSLETVPPIIEKVENLEPEEPAEEIEAESTMNAVGIVSYKNIEYSITSHV